MRALCILGLAACAGSPAYRLSVHEPYEVGEDPTIAVAIREPRKDQAVLVVTRPDGTMVRQKVRLAAEQTNVRFGSSLEVDTEPTFTERGDYRVELRANKTVLANQQIRISVDRLTRKFEDEEIAGFALLTKYTRPRANKRSHWKTYGAIYEHTARSDARIHVVIEDPGDAFDDAWKQYEEEGTLGVIQNNNVRFRDRAGSVSASWTSGKQIISMRATTLTDFESGFIAHFLARYPSDLDVY